MKNLRLNALSGSTSTTLEVKITFKFDMVESHPFIFTKVGIEKFIEKSALVQNLSDLSYIQLATFHNFEHLNRNCVYFDLDQLSYNPKNSKLFRKNLDNLDG